MAIWQDLIVCDGVEKECTFSSLMQLANAVITNLVVLATFLTAIAFMYAGFKLLTSGGSESAKTKAKDIFLSVLIGYLWILGAWLVVYTITSALLKPEYSFLERFKP